MTTLEMQDSLDFASIDASIYRSAEDEALHLALNPTHKSYLRMAEIALDTGWGTSERFFVGHGQETLSLQDSRGRTNDESIGSENPWYRVILRHGGSATATVDMQSIFNPNLEHFVPSFVRTWDGVQNRVSQTLNMLEPTENGRGRILTSFRLPNTFSLELVESL